MASYTNELMSAFNNIEEYTVPLTDEQLKTHFYIMLFVVYILGLFYLLSSNAGVKSSYPTYPEEEEEEEDEEDEEDEEEEEEEDEEDEEDEEEDEEEQDNAEPLVLPETPKLDSVDAEEDDTEYDDMPPLIDMAHPLETAQPYLRAKLRARNTLNPSVHSHFQKAFNRLKTIELTVGQVKQEIRSAKLEADILHAEMARKME